MWSRRTRSVRAGLDPAPLAGPARRGMATHCQARGAGGVERNSPDLSTHAARQRPLNATRSVRMRKRQIHAYHQAFATHACFRHGSARGRVLSWLGRHTAVQPCRTRHRRGFRSFRPPGSAHRARPDRPCRSVATTDDNPARVGSGRYDRARDGRSGGLADRQLPDRGRCPRVPGLRRFEPALRRGVRAGRGDRARPPAPGPGNRAIVHGPRGKRHPGRPSRFGRQPDPLISPRLRPRFGHRPAELPDRSHPAHVSP